MRTWEQIVTKIRTISDDEDFFGITRSDLMNFLPYVDAKEFLPPEEHEETSWTYYPVDREYILLLMQNYMPFAWKKANDFRGLSAARTLYHYTAWIWLLEDDDKFPNLNEYNFYGKDHLVAICEHYGWDHSLWDDGVRLNFEPQEQYKS